MNIATLLTPKENTKYIYSDVSVRQALEKFHKYGFSAIPVIRRDGTYVCTLTEGDLLWFILEVNDFDMHEMEHIGIDRIRKRIRYNSVGINEDIEELSKRILAQNFVPVVDDLGHFIGIVTRKSVLSYLTKVK